MNVARVLTIAAAALLGCSVPEVQFSGDSADATTDGSGREAAADGVSPQGDDGAGGSLDGATDAAGGDGGEVADAPYDGPSYCGNGGIPPPGGKCCAMNGPPCFGACNGPSCAACGACASPMVCCTVGSNGTCKMPPC